MEEMPAIDIDGPMVGEDSNPDRPGKRAAQVTQLGILSGAVRKTESYFVEPIFFRPGGLSDAIRQPKIQTLAHELRGSNDDIILFIEAFMDRIQKECEDPEVARFIDAAHKAADAFALPNDIGIGIVAIDFWASRILH